MPYHTRRIAFFLAGDAALIYVAFVAATTARFEGAVPARVAAELPALALVAVLVKLPFLVGQRLHAISWSRFGLGDLLRVVRGGAMGWLAFAGLVAWLHAGDLVTLFSRSVLLLDLVLSVGAVGAFRISRRVYLHLRHNGNGGGRAAVIMGAGSAGEQLARQLLEEESPFKPLAFLDDDPKKHGLLIHGLPVAGGRAAVSDVVGTYRAEAVLIAMPSAPPSAIRDIVARARAASVRDIRIIPGLARILGGHVTLADLRELELDDLLGRQVVHADTAAIGAALSGRTALVTGAAGSIGSEICRQILGFEIARLAILDSDETGLFTLEHELRRLGGGVAVVPVVGDVREGAKMRRVLRAIRPHVVYHAAAYKHVPVMEAHPDEAVKTNVLGTWATALAARECGVERFVMISTDKAVRPTSVMGATKRVAERVVATLNCGGPTRFMSVRFGNVLGSRGSVVPIWQEQIRRGGPVTVTHPEMRRYFMVTSEAVLLVLQASAMGRGGEVFVLDMGQPIRILDLAHEAIRLSGLEPEVDIPVVFTGARPGEKMTEEILTAEEGTAATSHAKLFVAPTDAFESIEALQAEIETLRGLVEADRPEDIVAWLMRVVPSYAPAHPADGVATDLRDASDRQRAHDHVPAEAEIGGAETPRHPPRVGTRADPRPGWSTIGGE